MNKTDLVNYISENSQSGLSKKQAAEAVDLLFDGVGSALERNEKVQLVGTITFEPAPRAPRKGFNPQTNEEINIPASVGVKIKAGKQLEKYTENLDVNKLLKEKADKKAANAAAKAKSKK
jgi:DNA-binding protein HU-beta